MKNPAALKNLGKGLSILASSLLVSDLASKDPSVKNYPFEMLLAGMIWAPIFSEIGCNNVGANLDGVGERLTPEALVTKKISFRERAKIFGKSYMSYMKWVPLNEATYVGLYSAAQAIRGQPVDLSPAGMIHNWGMIVLFDVVAAVPRNVLVLDPLYLKVFPKLGSAVDELVKNKVISGVVWGTTETALRVLLGSVSYSVYRKYQDWMSDDKSKASASDQAPEVDMNLEPEIKIDLQTLPSQIKLDEESR
jgi:hypothetical protein